MNYAITKDKAAALERLKASYEKQLEMLRRESKYSLDLLIVVVYISSICTQVWKDMLKKGPIVIDIHVSWYFSWEVSILLACGFYILWFIVRITTELLTGEYQAKIEEIKR